jgi:chromosome segregation ATPase
MRATTLLRTLFTAVLATTALGATSARADGATEARLREALRTSTTQLRALEEERASWQAREAGLKKEVETVRAQLAAAKRPIVKTNDREVAELNRRLVEQEESASKLSKALAQCQAGERDAADAARGKEEERSQLAAEAAALRERAAAAETKNTRLYGLGKEILDWISSEGVHEASEPLLGLKRVQLENVVQNYEDKLLDARSHTGGAP